MLTNWKPDRPFIDPFCGSGTIPIEAALIGQNIAQALTVNLCLKVGIGFSPKVWDDARTEAEDLANYDQPIDITGSDIDHRMVKIAQENAFEAGLGD